MFIKKHCSPSKKDNKISCIDDDLILKIANILNNYDYNIEIHKDKKKLHSEISKKIKEKSYCKNEKCWKTLNFLRDELSNDELKRFEESFRPDMPEKWIDNPNTWLSTIDINKVMEQYENAYPNFEYLGANPIDFDKKISNNRCVADELCNINIPKLKREGTDCLGMVFNTDPHDSSGQHWFSLYIDLKGKNIKNKPCIYYFDSLASKPKTEVIEFVKRIQKQCLEINKDIKFLYNDIKHQHENTECGVYCLHFLVSMLKGQDFKKYIKNKKSDKKIEKFRKFFFIPPK